MTQQELADILGVSQPYINNVVKGKSKLSSSCILSGFYIKPQPRALKRLIMYELRHNYNVKNKPKHSEEVVFDAIFQSSRISKNKYS